MTFAESKYIELKERLDRLLHMKSLLKYDCKSLSKGLLSDREQTIRTKEHESHAKSLYPLLRCFKVERNLLVYPDGHKIRINKVVFEPAKEIKKPTSSWNGINFLVDSTSNKISYSFDEIKISKEDKEVYQKEIKKQSNMVLALTDNSLSVSRVKSKSLIDFMKSHTAEEIEKIAIFGFQVKKKECNLSEKRIALTEKIILIDKLIKEVSNSISSLLVLDKVILMTDIEKNSSLRELNENIEKIKAARKAASPNTETRKDMFR